MKITSIGAYKIDLRLPEPFSISFKTFTHAENILVVIRTDEGFSGLGECAPFKPITGDGREEAEILIKAVSKKLMGKDPRDIEDIHKTVEEAEKDTGIHSQTAKAAIDFACYDLWGKNEEKPVYELLGAKTPNVIPTTLTIGIKSIEDTVKSAEKYMELYKDSGLRRIKLKLSGNPEEDVKRVTAVADVFSGELTLDANQGYKDPKVAVKVLNEIFSTVGKRVILIEEPCPKGDLEKMKYVSDRSEIPVFADESAATFEEARKVIEASAAKGINIKLQKAGGIYWASKIAEIACENNVSLMVGTMLESSISVAAGANFVSSSPGIINADLDADLYFSVKLTTSETTPLFKYGARLPSGLPGLGIELVEWLARIIEEDINIAKIST